MTAVFFAAESRGQTGLTLGSIMVTTICQSSQVQIFKAKKDWKLKSSVTTSRLRKGGKYFLNSVQTNKRFMFVVWIQFITIWFLLSAAIA